MQNIDANNGKTSTSWWSELCTNILHNNCVVFLRQGIKCSLFAWFIFIFSVRSSLSFNFAVCSLTSVYLSFSISRPLPRHPSSSAHPVSLPSMTAIKPTKPSSSLRVLTTRIASNTRGKVHRERKCRESICLIYPSHAKQIRKIRFSSSCIFYMGLISVLIFAVRNTVKERMKKSN